jgi:hypothetical protein
MRRLFAFMFLGLLLMGRLACSGTSIGGRMDEISAVQHTMVMNIARSGLKSSQSMDAWIKDEFYFGRFDVHWSSSEITDGANAGKIRVSANLRSRSVTKLEQSIVLRFTVDPQDKSVAFAGMELEGDELIAPSGKPYSLDGAIAQMWDRRRSTYLKDIPGDILEEMRNGG